MAGEEALKPTEDPALPRVPGYRLEALIGRGATGVVYRAVQLVVDRPVALKILHPELTGAKRAVRRLQREARTAAKLAHPNIISAIDMGEVDGRWWYAMELVEGESLAERLRTRGSVGERECLRLFLPLVEALQHAADHGVVHRDIKPANILLDGNGRARLVDLGLAFAESDPMLTSTGGTLGTPHYMSPEQARDPAAADTRSDLWSLGATLYHALCGQPPFVGESVAEILSGVLYRRIVDPRRLAPGLSRGMALVLRKCLARDPERRYASPAELSADLERLRERRAPRVSARALDPTASRWPRHAPWLLAGLGLAAATVAILVLALGQRGAGEVGGSAAPTSWPDLVDLEQRFDQGRILPAEALLRLDHMRLPEGLELELRENELRTRVRARVEEELMSFRVEIESRLDQLLASSDFDGAEQWLAAGAEDLLEARTGFARLEDLPPELSPAKFRTFVDALRSRVERRRSAAVSAAARELRRHVDSELPRAVRSALSERRWRSALELIDGALQAWSEEQAQRLAGLAEEERALVLAAAEAPLAELRGEVGRSFTELGERLVGDVRRWVETARRDLVRGERNVAQRLVERYGERLERESIDVEEFPSGLPFRPGELVATESQLLAEEELRLVEDDARQFFDESEQESRPLLQRRAYAEAAALWRARFDYGWPESQRSRVAMRLRECELLSGVLSRAAQRLRALHGERLELSASPTIVEAGTVIAGADPLERGFELECGGRLLRFALQPSPVSTKEVTTVYLHDLEALAELSSAGDGEARLQLALLRFHEGDYAGARAALPGLAAPEDELAADLRDRIEAASVAKSAEEERRRDDIAYGWRQARELHRRGKLQDALREIRKVLDDPELHALLSPAERTEWKDMRELLTRGPVRRSLQEAFAPDQLEPLTGPRQFRMRWSFDHPGVSGWKRGAWNPDGQGWSPMRAFPDDATLFEWDSSPLLRLDPPIDVDSSLRAVFQLELLEPSSPTQTIVITCAGIHFAFLSEGTVGYWRVDTTSAQATLNTLRKDRARAPTFRPFPREGAFTIDLRLHPRQARVESVEIAGRRLEGSTSLLPPDLIGPTLELRARERMRLRSVVLEVEQL